MTTRVSGQYAHRIAFPQLSDTCKVYQRFWLGQAFKGASHHNVAPVWLYIIPVTFWGDGILVLIIQEALAYTDWLYSV
jgi:hypothetical protein